MNSHGPSVQNEMNVFISSQSPDLGSVETTIPSTSRHFCLRVGIMRSVFFAGGRSSYDWSYAWSRDQQRLEKIDDKIHHIVGKRTTIGSHKRSIVRSIVAPDDRSYDQSWNYA